MAIVDPQLASLAQGTLQRQPRATEAFLGAVGPLVLRVVRQVLGRDHPDVEDVVQEALLGTLDALERFRGDCSLSHFVRRIALLTALNARRRVQLRRRIAPDAPDTEVDTLPARSRSPLGEMEAESRLRVFSALLDELPDAQAEAIGLHCILGYTVAETAQAAGVPLNTVRGRLVAAKTALRRRLEQDLSVQELFKGAS